jgi:hypothetical protein
MAGFSKVYFIGSTGGFMGADGLARPFIQILQGEGSRQWLEAIYQDENMRPMAGLQTLVPARPDDPVVLLDAAIVFASRLFEECPSFSTVAAQLEGVGKLDFDIGRSAPSEWAQLRREALPIFQELDVFEATLQPVDTRRMTGS